MDNTELKRFVENEIKIAESNIKTDTELPGRVTFWGFVISVFALANGVIDGKLWDGIGIFIVINIIAFFIARSFGRLCEERLTSHRRELENRQEQLKRIDLRQANSD